MNLKSSAKLTDRISKLLKIRRKCAPNFLTDSFIAVFSPIISPAKREPFQTLPSGFLRIHAGASDDKRRKRMYANGFPFNKVMTFTTKPLSFDFQL